MIFGGGPLGGVNLSETDSSSGMYHEYHLLRCAIVNMKGNSILKSSHHREDIQ